MTTGNTQAQSTLPMRNSRSILLQLPGELRNKVYQYALFVQAGICFRPRNAPTTGKKTILAATQPLHSPEHSPSELNQLKYVCRQLYYETATWELKVNTKVQFTTPTQFALISMSLPLRRLVWLKVAVIRDYVPSITGPKHSIGSKPQGYASAAVVANLASFCRRVPEIRVKYLVPIEQRSKCLMFASLNFYMQTLRDKDIFLTNDYHSDTISSSCHVEKVFWRPLRWREGRYVQEFHAANLTFWPTDTEKIEEGYQILTAGDAQNGLSEPLLAEWWGYLKAWAANGI